MEPPQYDSTILYRSLLENPLLCHTIGSYDCFDRQSLGPPEALAETSPLNFDQKLGHLYEDALAKLIQRSNRYELISQHLQVMDDTQRTIGEFDYLLQNRASGHYIHLELAVKFYMVQEQSGHWVYPGPNPNDNWQRKYQKLKSHQLTLAERPESKKRLQADFGIDTIESQHLIYGTFFRPIAQPDAPLPDSVSTECRQGIWLSINDWLRHFPEETSVRRIPKPYWPMPLDAVTCQSLPCISIEALQAECREKVVLIQHPHEMTACFVVPESWPAPTLNHPRKMS